MTAAALVLALFTVDGGAAKEPPRAVVEPAAFDFGRLRSGRRVEKELVLRNHGGRPLEVIDVATDCGCTLVSGYAKTVDPGGRTVLRVAFTAPDQPGRTTKRVLVKTNDPQRAGIEVTLSADVVAGRTSRR